MMFNFLAWYLLVFVVGWMAFPLAYRLLHSLPDRGYALSRPLGLLIWSYTFWLLASLQVLQNDLGGMVLALLVLFGLSLYVFLHQRQEIIQWLHGQARVIMVGELLFILAFAGWALTRAMDPAILGTEKPMEMAYINSILRSPAFPPNDPWLSGYAISYYYFGYIMVAILTRVSGVNPGVAFNLAISLWFALTALGAYGLVYGLLAVRDKKQVGTLSQENPSRSKATIFWGLLGPLYILLISNIEGFLEMLHARGIFWNETSGGTWHSAFWSWLNIQELVNPPTTPLTWTPNRAGGIWWWRASRVLQDFDMAHNSKEIIDEFPFFSYYLADLHPHVLAMPFALLAIGLALNLYLWLRNPNNVAGIFPVGNSLWGTIRSWWTGKQANWSATMVVTWLKQPFFWLTGLVLGGLAFLNTWDFPIYVALFCLVYGLSRYRQEGWSSRWIGEFLELGLALGVIGVLLYLPFYLGFASQAGGILPSLSFFTRGVYFWVMFASLIIPILMWLLWLWNGRGVSRLFLGLLPLLLAWLISLGLGANPALMVFALLAGGIIWYFGFHGKRPADDLKMGLIIALLLVVGLWVLSYLLGMVGANLSTLANLILNTIPPVGLSRLAENWNSLGGLFFALQGSSNPDELIWGSFANRLNEPGTWLTILVILTLVWGGLASLRPVGAKTDTGELTTKRTRIRPGRTNVSYGVVKHKNQHGEIDREPSDGFVLLLILVGTGLTLLPEFVYLRDQFGWRMNTIFKIYFQAWIVWGIAAAYASAILWRRLSMGRQIVYGITWFVLLFMALAYPAYGLISRASILDQNGLKGLTLDGTAHIDLSNPDEMAAIRWLRQAPLGVLAEAVGGSYTSYARISTNTGLPTILGWPGHESQWRGGAREMGSREADIRLLYQTSNWDEAAQILNQYQIRYIYIGSLERSTYRVNENKFKSILAPIFQQGDVVIYEFDYNAVQVLKTKQ